MRNDIGITCVLNDIRGIKDITIIRCIASLRSGCSNSIISTCIMIMTVFLLLTFNLFFCPNIVRMSRILEVNIVFLVYLNDITTLDFIDNVCILQLIIRIFHQQFFTDNSIIRNLAIIVMIMVSMRGYITLVSDLYDDLFCVDSLSLTDFIWCQVLCLLTSLITVYISNSIRIFLNLTSLISSKFIGTNT